MLKMLAKFLKVLNSDAEPGQISLALCLAMIAGLTPLFSFHNLIVLLLVLVLRANLSAFILGWVVFSGLAYPMDHLFNGFGLALLQAEALRGLWTSLYKLSLFRLAHFNNSIVMGSLAFSLIAFIPFFFLANFIVKRYREHVLAWIQKSRIMQVFKASKLYTIYQNIPGWGGSGS